MFFLSPVKLLVVLVVALMVLGPDKLPKVAGQVGALWGDLRRWRVRLESEVRTAFPDLPPVHEIAHAVRSPLTYLDRLADVGDAAKGAVGWCPTPFGTPMSPHRPSRLDRRVSFIKDRTSVSVSRALRR